MKNIFKKIFGGKSQGNSEDGTNIYRYEQSNNNEGKIAYTPYAEEIAKHFNDVFPGRESINIQEIISDITHIDITVMEGTEEQPFKILYSTGMSSMPMTLPDEFPDESKELYCRAELMMFLPRDWQITEESAKDQNNYWPVTLMKQLARFPHMYNTWLSYGHTIPNYETYDNYADNTGLNGTLLTAFKEEVSVINTKDGNRINIYCIIPVYKEEIEYKLENGMDALMEKLDSVEWLILDPQRENTCK